MAFVIKNIDGSTPGDIHAAISAALRKSRFTARIDYSVNKVSIHDVRLKESKDYCGNHPYACPVRPGGHQAHKRQKFLEGADWVAFNDGINNVLDGLGVSANVASSLVVIRKGLERCVSYYGHSQNGISNEWDKQGFYENHIGKPHPKAEYPEGTPGIYSWTGGTR
jgi:hypothetical protein